MKYRCPVCQRETRTDTEERLAPFKCFGMFCSGKMYPVNDSLSIQFKGKGFYSNE